MKILFAGASADRYGADLVLRSIATHFHASGTDCVLVLPEEGPGALLARNQGLRVQILAMPVLRRSDLNRHGLLKLMASLLPSLASHVRLLRRERPDVVWVNTITIPLWLIAARLLGIRVVCHSHELVGGSRFIRRLLYSPLFLTDRVLVVSEACRNDIVRTFRRLGQRVSVAINASFSVRKPLPVQPGCETEMVVLGRISARKGHDVLVEALGDDRLAGLTLVVHVCGAPYRSPAAATFASTLRENARELDAEVRFHGYVPTEEALAMGGIVVVPSTEPDPCPLVVAEALTAGRAVVASDCGGIPEIAGGAALLVTARRSDALAAGLARVLSDPDERRMLEEASLRRAKLLAPEHYFSRIDDLLRELIDEGAPTTSEANRAERTALIGRGE